MEPKLRQGPSEYESEGPCHVRGGMFAEACSRGLAAAHGGDRDLNVGSACSGTAPGKVLGWVL